MEAVGPLEYFRYRFYEKWLTVITEYLIENNYLTGEELHQRASSYCSDPSRDLPIGGSHAIDDQVINYLRHGDSPRRGAAQPIFELGELVTVANPRHGAHTRLPGYLRGHTGVVARIFEGNYAYPLATDDGLGKPMPVYLVRFESHDLWGSASENGGGPLFAELYETYLSKRKNAEEPS